MDGVQIILLIVGGVFVVGLVLAIIGIRIDRKKNNDNDEEGNILPEQAADNQKEISGRREDKIPSAANSALGIFMIPIYGFSLLFAPEELFRHGLSGVGSYLVIVAVFFAVLVALMQIPGCDKVVEFFIP